MTSLDVTVPCSSCTAPVGFPGRRCPRCGAGLSSDLRAALEARLEAADEDFRDARANVRTASSILLQLALITMAIGVGEYVLMATSGFDAPAERAEWAAELVLQLALGAVFLGCFAWVKDSPVLAIATGLVVWLGVQIAVTVALPLTAMPMGLAGFLVAFYRLVVFVLLVRGLVAAVRGRALLRKVTR
jgi:hypothetical protein